MTILDAVLLIILAGFIFYGLFFGLIRTLGALTGTVVGALLALKLYGPVAGWLDGLFFGYDNIGKLIVFLLIFTLINRLVGFGFAVLDRAFDVISIIPFLKTINRLAGAMLGFLLGTLVIGLLLYALTTFFGAWFKDFTSGSSIVPLVSKSFALIFSFLPLVWDKVRVIGLEIGK